MSITVNEASAVLREAVRQRIRRRSTLFLLQGAFLILAGLLALVFPLFFGAGLLVMIGWLLIIASVIQGVGLIGAQQAPYFWLHLVAVILGLVMGFLLVTRPEAGLLAVALLLVIYFMIDGLARIVFALTIRPMDDWEWLLASGVVGVILAMVVAAQIGTVAHWLLGTMVGAYLIVAGAALAWPAWKLWRNAG